MRRKWSNIEDKILIDSYHYKTVKEIAFDLKRTEKSISERAKCLKLSKRNEKNWTQDEKEKLYELLSKGFKYKVIATLLNRSIESCKSFLYWDRKREFR